MTAAMQFDNNHRSDDIIDRRGQGGGGRRGGGGLLRVLLPLLRTRAGRWIALVIAVVAGVGYLLIQVGVLPATLLSGGGQRSAPVKDSDEVAKFVGFVLDDCQDTWMRLDPKYQKAKLVLFTDSTDTACGYGDAATGPFYCPADKLVYIDLSFYQQLSDQLGAPGDFAQAYVVAHEIGHHVQTLRGTNKMVRRASKDEQTGEHGLLVRMELQADCFAGVWAHSTKERKLLDQGDIEEALRAAAAIGDDTLQKRSGRVRPESFTHGSAKQRARWFGKGLETGDPDACDTFAAGRL